MAKNTEAIPAKITGSAYAASEFEVLRGFVDTPIQPLTDFTDANIIVDGTKSYSTIKAITAATHTITANATPANHIEGNYLTVRYSFSQDCTLTLQNFDSSGNQTGTIAPIPAGIYDFYFIAGAFGVWLGIKNNTGSSLPVLTTPLMALTPTDGEIDYVISSEDANATNGILEYSEDLYTWIPDPNYVFAVKSGSIINLTNGILYYVRFKNTAAGYSDSLYVTGQETPSASVTQLTPLTLGTVTEATGQLTVDFTNPNGGNEDSNDFEYKLDTEPTTWTAGPSVATSGTQAIITGLTDDLLYNVRGTAIGTGTYSNSNLSNVVNGTPTSTISAEAQAVLDRMTGLTTTEENAIIAYVDAEVTAGNWALTDEFWFYGLALEANALTGFKLSTSININTATKTSNGFVFDGSTNYIETNFDLLNDATNYQDADAMFEMLIHTPNVVGGTKFYGAHENASSVGINKTSGGAVQGQINSATITGTTLNNTLDKSTVAMVRTGATASEMRVDGSVDNTSTTPNGTTISTELYIGCRNDGGLPELYGAHTCSAVLIGGAVGFDHTSHNTNIQALLTAMSI